MSCNAETAEFKFTKEQSEEFAAITHDFLIKNFSDKTLPVKIEIEVRFVPKIIEAQALSIIYGCIEGGPQSPLCDTNEKWGPMEF